MYSQLFCIYLHQSKSLRRQSQALSITLKAFLMIRTANVTLFSDESKSEDDYFIASMAVFAKEQLGELSAIIAKAYDSANGELHGRRPAGVRRNSRPVRVNEKIAELCSVEYGNYYREVPYGKFMLYFPDVCQIHILKTNKRQLPPRTTRTAIDQTMQTNLPFPDCPILHVGHEMQNGRVGVTLMYYRNGICRWSIPLSELLAQNVTLPINKATTKAEEEEVFATPKRKQKKELETA
jgi:hypothetical protein